MPEFLQQWSYDTDYGDHFETPKRAYVDIKPALHELAVARGQALAAVRVYDPYYCTGRAKKLLRRLGFEKILHRKRDFYADIAAAEVPAHDVLVSNPPYSADHKDRLLAYILAGQCGRGAGGAGAAAAAAWRAPFLLLLPAWSANKLAWRRFLWCMQQLRSGDKRVTMEGAASLSLKQLGPELEEAAGAFYICPHAKYEFKHPDDSGRPTAPFFGIWFCGGWPTETAAASAVAAVERVQAKGAPGGGRPVVLRSLAELQQHGLVPTPAAARERIMSNPKQRAHRDAALRQQDAARKVAPEFKAKKKQKRADLRNQTVVRYTDSGLTVTAELAASVQANAKVCTHFFGLGRGGDRGCNMADKCRFLHSV
jgi:hypothetical protein